MIYSIPPWLLALITLIISSAVGVYYLNPKLYTSVPEGFFTVKTDQAKCEASKTSCMGVGGDNAICTSIYNDCIINAAATPSTPPLTATPSAPSASSASSASPSVANSQNYPGSVNINDYVAKQKAALSGMATQSSDAYNKLLASLSERVVTGGGADKPTEVQLSLAQGDNTGYPGATAAEYKAHQQIIKPHMTPTELKAAIQANVAADKGTQAQAIQEEAILTPSLRDMIRNDVKKAIKGEIRDIKNEYEIQYTE